MIDLAAVGLRSYVAEPDRGRRNWSQEPQAQTLVYANRRRLRGARPSPPPAPRAKCVAGTASFSPSKVARLAILVKIFFRSTWPTRRLDFSRAMWKCLGTCGVDLPKV